MSYAELLSQYSNKMNEVRNHADQVATANAAMKAGTLKEKYDEAQQHLATASGAITGVSAAYEAGRKLYRKLYRGKGSQKPAEEDENKSGEPQEEEPTDGSNPPAEGQEGASGEGASGVAEEGAGEGAEAGGDTITDLTNIIPKAQPIEDISEAAPKTDPTGDLGRNVESDDTPDAPTEEPAAQGPTLEGAPDEVVEATAGDATEAAGVAGGTTGDALSSGASAAGNLAGKAATSVARTATQDAATSLGTEAGTDAATGLASQALDWLGPVGLGIGAIAGLTELFEGIFGKKPKTAAETQKPLEAEGAGVDVSALSKDQGSTSATLV